MLLLTNQNTQSIKHALLQLTLKSTVNAHQVALQFWMSLVEQFFEHISVLLKPIKTSEITN